MRAIISDIHSNYEALKAVLEDIRRQDVDEIFCLGDVVGYGPQPEDCIDEARKFHLCLMGNHDEAVHVTAVGFNPIARQAVEWTRQRLEPKWYSMPGRRARWDFITTLPLKHEKERLTFVHGGPRAPTWDYILPDDTAIFTKQPSERLIETFNLIDGPCFVGHTHVPGVIETVNGPFVAPVDLDWRYEYSPDVKAVINVGSVGQPRDGDPRACYVTIDDEVVTYHRVEYDWEKTAHAIYDTEGLPNEAGERLAEGF